MTTVLRRPVAAALCVAALGVAGCGSDAPDERYADGWDAICADVRGALQGFRTDLVTSARSAPDAGDEAARQPLPRADAAAILERPAERLGKALRTPLEDVRVLDPPDRWRRWHADAVERFATQVQRVETGIEAVSGGDAEALPSLAIGGFGPASIDAPQDLRNRTPTCVALR